MTRLKEQLIRELVKTGQDSQHINREYQQKIAALQKEKDEALSELNGLQVALKELENREKNDKAKTERLQRFLLCFNFFISFQIKFSNIC